MPAELVWAPDDVLLAAGVRPYTELPMWAPDIPELAGTWEASGDRARLAGMRYRPLADTVAGHLGAGWPMTPPHRPSHWASLHSGQGSGLTRRGSGRILAGL